MRMKRVWYIFLLAVLVSCGSDKNANLSAGDPVDVSAPKVSLQSVLSGLAKGDYKQGELLVKFKSGVLSTSSLRTHGAIGARVIKRIPLIKVDHVSLPNGVTVRDAIIKYMQDPDVEYAEPDYILHLSSTVPNDPLFNFQWGLNNTGQTVNGARGAPGSDIKAPDAWDISTGNSSVIVAVLDTGIDLTHPDLHANVISGYNFIDNNNHPMDDEGHGTHVSGIIGAAGSNGIGVSGVMWNVKLMPVKVCSHDPAIGCPEDTVAEGITFAISPPPPAVPAKVINMSFGTSPGGPNPSPLMDAVKKANSAGVLIVTSAGNDTNNNDINPVYPASYAATLPNVISVAATDQNDALAPFSNFGPASIGVAAPGVNILSTYLPSTYAFDDGTSMSAPFVTGLAGLLCSYYTNFTYGQIRGTILRYVDSLPALSGKTQSGGRINAFKAISSLLTPTGLSLSSSSGQVSLTWTDNATGEDGYKVERKTSGGSYNQIAALNANSTSYTDNSLIDGTVLSYRVKAANNIPAESLPSNEVSTVLIPINPPSGLAATAVSDTGINLQWTNNSKSADGFKIERKSAGTDFTQTTTVGSGPTSFSDTGLDPSTAYTYRVRAFNSVAGDSTYSNEASATTLETPTPSGGGGGRRRLFDRRKTGCA